MRLEKGGEIGIFMAIQELFEVDHGRCVPPGVTRGFR